MSEAQDIAKLSLAIEYVDVAAALYIAGGSDHAAQLLASAGELLLGDLGRMRQSKQYQVELQQVLTRVVRQYRPAPSTGMARTSQLPAVQQAHDSVTRSDTAALLRAAWYTLESMGLEAAAPPRLQKAIRLSTICNEAED